MSDNPIQHDNGIVTIASQYDAETTAQRLETVINEKGLTLIVRVNHAAAAARVDEQLAPTELFLFGNPKAGTPLMQARQLAGIDLPQKMLVWQDSEQQVWISYNAADYIATRHAIEGRDELIENTNQALSSIAQQAAH